MGLYFAKKININLKLTAEEIRQFREVLTANLFHKDYESSLEKQLHNKLTTKRVESFINSKPN